MVVFRFGLVWAWFGLWLDSGFVGFHAWRLIVLIPSFANCIVVAIFLAAVIVITITICKATKVVLRIVALRVFKFPCPYPDSMCLCV